MPWICGTDPFRYEAVDDWAKLPDGLLLKDVAGVAVDADDRVYLFHRGRLPVLVLDAKGNLLHAFGEGRFRSPHAIQVTPGQELLLTDSAGHAVYKYTLDGRHMMTIGTPDRPAPFLSGLPFNRPTHTAVSPGDDIYVADGYGNGRVHRYTADGRYLRSWGTGTGTEPGAFNVVHNICCDADGLVYVADRENHRIQVFDEDGKYLRQINNLHRPTGLFMRHVSAPEIYVAEFGPPMSVNRAFTNLGPRISILDNRGSLLSRFGGPQAGLGDEEFVAPHTLAVNSRGDLFVGEVSSTMWRESFPDSAPPEGVRTLRVFRRLPR